MRASLRRQGFTIIELLIVVVVIVILAAVIVVGYNGAQTRARESKAKSDIAKVQQRLEVFKAQNGYYPRTASALDIDWMIKTARTDSKCTQGTAYSQWVPGFDDLPQSDGVSSFYAGEQGCYIYVSDGTDYVLSAWGMMTTDMTGKPGYRLTGFVTLEVASPVTQFYMCNDPTIASMGYYKHSYTVTTIPPSTCA